jgi:hypothetical protein
MLPLLPAYRHRSPRSGWGITDRRGARGRPYRVRDDLWRLFDRSGLKQLAATVESISYEGLTIPAAIGDKKPVRHVWRKTANGKPKCSMRLCAEILRSLKNLVANAYATDPYPSRDAAVLYRSQWRLTRSRSRFQPHVLPFLVTTLSEPLAECSHLLGAPPLPRCRAA